MTIICRAFDRMHLENAIGAVNSGDFFYLHSAVDWFVSVSALIFQMGMRLIGRYMTEHKLPPKLTQQLINYSCRDFDRIFWDEEKETYIRVY